MLPEKFFEVLNYEGTVSMTTWGDDIVHVTCTWNSYIKVIDDKTLLVPSVGMKATEEDLNRNSRIIITLGASELEGLRGFPGTAFEIQGQGKFLDSGEYFDMTKENHPYITRVLLVQVDHCQQIL